MKTWPWLMSLFLVLGALVHAQTDPVVPADDRKEPKTLSKVVNTAQTVKPAADLLDDTSALKSETNFNPPFVLALPTPPVPVAIKTKPVKTTVDQVKCAATRRSPPKRRRRPRC
jgi:hypothetical protein